MIFKVVVFVDVTIHTMCEVLTLMAAFKLAVLALSFIHKSIVGTVTVGTVSVLKVEVVGLITLSTVRPVRALEATGDATF